MIEALLNLLGAERYSQHAVCLTNDPIMMFFYILGDGVTAMSYFTIGAVLYLRWFAFDESPVMARRQLAPLYAAFIFLCVMSHLSSLATLFWGIYRLDVFITACMAGVSGATAWFTLYDYVNRRDAGETVGG